MKYKGGVFLIVAAIAAPALTIAINHHYSDGAHVAQAVVAREPSSLLLIGDSWVVDGILDGPIQNALARRGISVQVHSHGYPGERTGPIYEHLAALPETAANCVIVAGVNDALGHFGPHYYAHHIRLMVQLDEKRGCNPVVVELPRYDQSAASARLPVYLKARDLLYRYIFDAGHLSPINEYREAARSDLSDNFVSFVNPDDAIGTPQSRPKLWENPSHLTASGRAALGDAISSTIAASKRASPRQ